MPKLKTGLARLFLIALLLFGLWQVPLSGWESLWNWAIETGKLIVLGR